MLKWFEIHEKHFTPKECQQIIAYGQQQTLKDAVVGAEKDQRKNDELRRSKITWLVRWQPEFQWFMSRIDLLVQKSNLKSFGFDVAQNCDVQFTEYDSSYLGKYDWHVDVFWLYPEGQTRCHRKLSVVIQLSDPAEYEGGDLELDEGKPDKSKIKQQGSVIVFPSFLKHRVTPVTKGKRNSLVTWYEGPFFK